MGFENYASLPRHRNPGANTKRGPGDGREGKAGEEAGRTVARNEETNRGGAGGPNSPYYSSTLPKWGDMLATVQSIPNTQRVRDVCRKNRAAPSAGSPVVQE